MKSILIGSSLLCFVELICCQPRKSENELRNEITDSIRIDGMTSDYPEENLVDSLKIFGEPETSANFPSGYDSLKSFIDKNLISPKQSVNIEGKVFVEFIVSEDGTLSEFKILKGLCPECDKNAIELLKKMPKWIPGKVNGIPEKQKFVLPVRFSL